MEREFIANQEVLKPRDERESAPDAELDAERFALAEGVAHAEGGGDSEAVSCALREDEGEGEEGAEGETEEEADAVKDGDGCVRTRMR